VHDSQVGDRYLLCSDGLSGVVSDETLRETLAGIEEPDAVTRQLIELALQGGGPDNITCIVADVVDTATSRMPPTGTPIMAGAAAGVSDPMLSTDGSAPGSSFGGIEDHLGNHYAPYDEHGQPSITAPQPMVAVDDLDPAAMPLTVATGNGTDPTMIRGPRSHRAQPKRRRSGRRRWPIVTTSLVVLLAVIIGGGYIAWRWSQDQYYVGADSKGQVVIYRGVNQRIAGISLSSPYQATGIQLAQVPAPYQQTVKGTDAASSLSNARAIVANVRNAVNGCLQQYTRLQTWVTAETSYLNTVARAQQQHKSTKSIVNSAGQKPPDPSGMCPPSTAYGIPASAIVAPSTATGHS
jgi:PPM family protein phosphatase